MNVCHVRLTSAPSMNDCDARNRIAASHGSRIGPRIQSPIGSVNPVFGRPVIRVLNTPSPAWRSRAFGTRPRFTRPESDET